jgi:hypothetical protein
MKQRKRASLSERITVKVKKYDGTDYREWSGTVSRRDGSLLQLDAAFSIEVSHHSLGLIRRGTRLVEYYWLDRWYNVLRFLDEDGSTRFFYCNVTTPPKMEGDLLTYVDLDIDVLALPDLSYEILDLDEFDRNVALYGYSEEIKLRSQGAIDELTSMIEARQFPFDS